MNHPFKVGENYENMNGSYIVESIIPPKMHIKYENGTDATVDLAIQARIWERIQDELTLAKQEFERRVKVNRPTISFSGLMESDFKDNVAGTNWRSREGLAGLVSKQLTDLSGIEFTSVAIYRRPEFFVYPPHLPMFNQQEGVKLPKFVVRLSPNDVLYGFYIEKSDDKMDGGWYWPRFLQILSIPKWQKYLEQVMADLNTNWIMRFEEKTDENGPYRLTEAITLSSFGEGEHFTSLTDFVTYLTSINDGPWCNLYFANTMTKEDAIAQQSEVSRPISKTFFRISDFYSELLNRAT